MPKSRKNILTGRRAVLKSKRRGNGGSRTRTISISATNVYKTIVPSFLNMLNTVKLYHWKTLSYATHKATDDLYGKLNEKLDEFVEVMLGKGEIAAGKNRDNLLNVQLIKLTPFSNNAEFKKQIEYYISFLLALSNNATFNVLMNVDLLAIRDEIVATLNQFLYLLTLN
jgi:hypothetical protein